MMQAPPGLARKVTAATCRLYADEIERSVVVLIHHIKHTHSYDMCCRGYWHLLSLSQPYLHISRMLFSKESAVVALVTDFSYCFSDRWM